MPSVRWRAPSAGSTSAAARATTTTSSASRAAPSRRRSFARRRRKRSCDGGTASRRSPTSSTSTAPAPAAGRPDVALPLGAAWFALPLAGVTVVSTLAGGLVALRLARNLETAIALTGGVVVAVALFHVLPEATEHIDDPRRVGLLVGAGFVVFFLAERGLVLHHRDEPEQARAHARVGALGAAALSVHSFIDGLGIGLAFGLDTATGLLVFLAVVAHDFADGLNTVSFVLSQSGDRKQAVRWLRIDAVAPVLGAIVGSALTISDAALGHILALYAGFFLYLGATDLLPEAHHEHGSWARVGLTVLGFAFVFGLVQIAHV